MSTKSTFFPPEILEEFYADWFRTHLRAPKEPRLHSMAVALVAYRFLWLRTFDEPIAIRAQRENDQTLLHVKQCSGEGGYDPGNIVVNTTRKLSDEEWERIVTAINEIGFWKLPAETVQEDGIDGAEWVIDGFDRGRYHVVHRWTEAAFGSIAPFGMLMIEPSVLRIQADDVY